MGLPTIYETNSVGKGNETEREKEATEEGLPSQLPSDEQ